MIANVENIKIKPECITEVEEGIAGENIFSPFVLVIF